MSTTAGFQSLSRAVPVYYQSPSTRSAQGEGKRTAGCRGLQRKFMYINRVRIFGTEFKVICGTGKVNVPL